MSDTIVVNVPDPEPEPVPEPAVVVVETPASDEGAQDDATNLDFEHRLTVVEEAVARIESVVAEAQVTAQVAESTANAALDEAFSEPEPVVVEEPEPEPEPEPDEAPNREHWWFK